MAGDTSLLFKIRAENSQAKATLADTRAAVSQLRNTFGTEFNQIQTFANSSLGKVSQSLTQVTGQIPVLGTALGGLSTSLNAVATESTLAGTSLAAIAAPVAGAIAAVGALVGGVFILGKGLF